MKFGSLFNGKLREQKRIKKEMGDLKLKFYETKVSDSMIQVDKNDPNSIKDFEISIFVVKMIRLMEENPDRYVLFKEYQNIITAVNNLIRVDTQFNQVSKLGSSHEALDDNFNLYRKTLEKAYEEIKEAYDTVYNMESGILESYAHID